MTDLFSSPSKTASQAASGVTSAEMPILQNLENYTNTGEQAVRSAIAGQGSNPYFGTAGTVSPSSYAVNPQNTVNFGAAPAPGLSQGTTTQTANPFTAPASAQGYGITTLPYQQQTGQTVAQQPPQQAPPAQAPSAAPPPQQAPQTTQPVPAQQVPITPAPIASAPPQAQPATQAPSPLQSSPVAPTAPPATAPSLPINPLTGQPYVTPPAPLKPSIGPVRSSGLT